MIVVAVMVLIVSWGEDPFFHHITIMDGDTVVKTETIFGEDGYVLPAEVDGIEGIAGWLYDGKEYEAGERIYPDGDVTITAIKGTIISISLYDDVTTHVILKKGETEFTLPVKPTRNGYDFDGWKVDGTVMNPGDKVTYTEGMVISAVWTKLYYVTYYNGTTLVETKSFREGAGLELNDGKALSNGDLIFTGWSRTNGSKTAEFAGGSTYSENKDITLYAVWSSDISIIYMSEGVQVQKVSGSPADMKTWNPDDSDLSKTGYKLDGWYTADKGEGTYYAVDSSITTSMTLYAHWVDTDLSFNDLGDDKSTASASNYSTTTIEIPSVYHGRTVTKVLGLNQCSKLTSFKFEKASNITSIGSFANTKLTSIDLSGTRITEIVNNMFSYCSSLTSVTLPSTVTSIGSGIFSTSDNVTSITLPSSVTSINSQAFESRITVNIDKEENSISGSPWGAGTVNWKGQY